MKATPLRRLARSPGVIGHEPHAKAQRRKERNFLAAFLRVFAPLREIASFPFIRFRFSAAIIPFHGSDRSWPEGAPAPPPGRWPDRRLPRRWPEPCRLTPCKPPARSAPAERHAH